MGTDLSDALPEVGPDIIWTPQHGPQKSFIECPFRDVFYGGAAGGGKSDALIGDFVGGVGLYGGAWHGILVRQTFPMLDEIESRCLEILSPHFGVSAYKRGRRTWVLPTPTGEASLKLRAIEDGVDALKHQGQAYTWVGFDELTQWKDDEAFEYLITRNRPRKGIPGGERVPLYIRSTGNPGGAGHNWVKDRYRIGEYGPMKPWVYAKDKKTGEELQRCFVPASLDDNKILTDNDPTYEMTLDNIADPMLRKALRHGDWNIAMGAAFSEFSTAIHVVKNHEVPHGALVWRACDWGYDKPFAVLWVYADYDGNLCVFNEMYGYGGKPNVGSKLDPGVLADRIREFEKNYNVHPIECLLDPQCWAEDGREDIYKLLGGPKMRWRPWPKGKGSRESHKQLVHNYLKVVNDVPRITFMERCVHTIRTLPVLPLKRGNPRDIETTAEDHCYDTLRGILAAINPNIHRGRKSRYEREAMSFLENHVEDDGFGKYGGH